MGGAGGWLRMAIRESREDGIRFVQNDGLLIMRINAVQQNIIKHMYFSFPTS